MSEQRCTIDQAHWCLGQELLVGGQGWERSALPDDWSRLPKRAEAVVPEAVWRLSRYPAGIYIDLESDSCELFVRWRLGEERWLRTGPASETMVYGVDVYGEDAEQGWAWVGAGVPAGEQRDHQAHINTLPLDGQLRRYRVYLPLSSRIERIEVGVSPGSILRPAMPENAPRIVSYGTSIVHGWTVSRPGMAHPAQLARQLRRPLIALGFAGNARMEPALADLVAEITADCAIIDCLPNMSSEQIHQRCRDFVHTLRRSQPTQRILLVGDRVFGGHCFMPQRAVTWQEKNAALDECYAALLAEGVEHLALLPGADFFAADGTVDGSHPNDLGSWRMAQQVYAALSSNGFV